MSRKKKKNAHPADPTPRSPAETIHDESYERAPSSGVHHETYPASCMYVVRHKETDTYWRCYYSIRDDDSDYDLGASWSQVNKIERTVVDYKEIP